MIEKFPYKRVKLDEPVVCVHEEAEPHTFVDYLVCPFTQNLIGHLRIHCWQQSQFDKGLTHYWFRSLVELLGEEFVEGVRKIGCRKAGMIGMCGQPKYSWPTMGEGCETPRGFGAYMLEQGFRFLLAHCEGNLANFV